MLLEGRRSGAPFFILGTGSSLWKVVGTAAVFGAVVSPLATHPAVASASVILPAALFRWCACIAAVATFALVAKGELSLDGRDPVLWCAVVFLLLAILSATLGPAPWRSFYGDFRRMGGVAFWLFLVLYYVAARHLMGTTAWRWYFRGVLGIAALASVVAFAQHFGWTQLLLWYPTSRDFAFGPIPNPGLFGGYLLVSIGAGLWVLDQARTPNIRLAAAMAVAVLAGALTLTGNRSSIAGITVAAGVLAIWAFVTSRFAAGRKFRGAAAGALLVGTFGFLVSRYGHLVEVPVVTRLSSTALDEISLRSRTYFFAAAVRAFRDAPLLGWGPENFLLVFTRYHDTPEFQQLGSAYEDRAHNQLFEFLSTHGLLGTLSYLAIWVAVGHQLIAASRAGRLGRSEALIFSGLGIAVAIYLQFWWHELSSAMLLVGIAGYLRSRNQDVTALPAHVPTRRVRVLTVTTALVLIAFTYQRTVPVVHAAVVADAALRQPNAEQAFRGYARAIGIGGPEMSELRSVYARGITLLSPSMEEIREDPGSLSSVVAAAAEAETGISELIDMDPLFDLWYLDRGDLYQFMSILTENRELMEYALADYRRAEQLSPYRLTPILNQALGYLVLGDFASAEEVLWRADRLHPGNPQTAALRTRYALRRGDFDAAERHLRTVIGQRFWRGVGDLDLVVERWAEGGQPGRAADLLGDYLAARSAAGEESLSSADTTRLRRLPLLELRSGDLAAARDWADTLARRIPADRLAADRFSRDLAAGRVAGWLQNETLTDAVPAR